MVVSNQLKGTVMNPEAVYGKSAYEIAVENGFVGTEQEWVEYISANVGRAEAAAIRAEEAADRAEDAGGGGGIGITREHVTGSGSVTIKVQDQYVYYVDGYSDVTVEIPEGDFSAHFFVSFPDDALSCSFNLPEGTAAFGNDLAECDFGERWEISIDSVGGALALRKRGL